MLIPLYVTKDNLVEYDYDHQTGRAAQLWESIDVSVTGGETLIFFFEDIDYRESGMVDVVDPATNLFSAIDNGTIILDKEYRVIKDYNVVSYNHYFTYSVAKVDSPTEELVNWLMDHDFYILYNKDKREELAEFQLDQGVIIGGNVLHSRNGPIDFELIESLVSKEKHLSLVDIAASLSTSVIVEIFEENGEWFLPINPKKIIVDRTMINERRFFSNNISDLPGWIIQTNNRDIDSIVEEIFMLSRRGEKSASLVFFIVDTDIISVNIEPFFYLKEVIDLFNPYRGYHEKKIQPLKGESTANHNARIQKEQQRVNKLRFHHDQIRNALSATLNKVKSSTINGGGNILYGMMRTEKVILSDLDMIPEVGEFCDITAMGCRELLTFHRFTMKELASISVPFRKLENV